MEPPDQVFRDGQSIVVPKGAPLPPFCVRCGSDEVTMVNRDIVWLNPLFYLSLFLGPGGLLIVYMIARKKVRLLVPLCERHRKIASRMRVATAVLLIGGPVAVALLIALRVPDSAGWGLVLILITLLGGMITLRLQRPLTASRIDDDRVTLKGACNTFLARITIKAGTLP